MNLALILRAEVVCLIILLFMIFISRAYRMGKDSRVFNYVLLFAVMHVVMDMVTLYTVNNQDTVPLFVNKAAHGIFYLSAVLYSYVICLYTLRLSRPREACSKKRLVEALPVVIYAVLLCTQVLTIEFEQLDGTKSSTGTAPVLAYVIALVYYAISTISILIHWKRIGSYFKRIMIPALVLLFVTVFTQTQIKEFLFTDCSITVITVAFFFTLENPAAVLERKVMMDALSGLGTRSGFERDMQEFDREFDDDRNTRFIFLYMDISNLRRVNSLYGHQEGDNYISDVAVAMMNGLQNTKNIYRMGGDEFLAIYRKTEEEDVIQDIRRVQNACKKGRRWREDAPELAIGYAISDPKYNSLRDVLQVAEYMMYRSKADVKRDSAETPIQQSGARLNLSGLTDRVFDAMCLTSEEFYPYLSNMETDVTRVAPAMKEYFGLESEFVNDFRTVWGNLIHPDDRQEFYTDLRTTLEGSKRFHFCRYRVKAKNGEYVEVACRGGIYHGRDGEPDVFAGYIVNHGAAGTVDSATGLRNHHAMYGRVNELLQENRAGIAIRLEIRNLNRIRMLYSGEVAASMIRIVSGDFARMVDGDGEVFSNRGANFMVILPDYDEAMANRLYQQIRKHCKAGIPIDGEVIPVDVTGGAVKMPDETLTTPSKIRQAALFAAEEAHYHSPSNLVFFGETGKEAGTSDKDLLKEIQHDCVMDRDNFYLRFQPIIRAQTGELAGAEALLRWRSDEYGEVAPGRFINYLENDPAYEPLGYEIIRYAVRIAAKIRKIIPDFRISVNITALQLLQDDFIPNVLRILDEEKYEPAGLMMELTERCKEIEFAMLNERVLELKKTGIRVALDDMGTGYSTLDLLLHLNANEIKLDMTFTQELQGMEKHEILTRTLCAASARYGTDICFEGVETGDMAEYLKGYGNVLLQGYFYDKPMLVEDFMEKYCRTDAVQDE